MTKKKHGKVKKPSKLIRTPKYQSIAAIVVVVVAAVLGYFLFIASHAASPSVSGEAENGTLSGTACKVTSTGASGTGNNAVQFGGTACTTTLPPTGGSGHPLLGLWDDGSIPASKLGVSQQATLIFASTGSDGHTYCGYNSLPNDDPNYKSTTSPNIPIISIGECDAAEAASIANYLVKEGVTNALVRPMWEMNTTATGSNSFGWQWGESTSFTAAAYISTWQTIYNTMKGINSGFKFIWCPNSGAPGTNLTQDGIDHNLSNRSESDTYPGDSYVDYVGVDIYDWWSSAAGDASSFETFAAAHGKPMVIPEWGLNGSNDPTFINNISSFVHNPSNNVYLQSYFSYDGGTNSDLTDPSFASSLSAYKTDFAGE